MVWLIIDAGNYVAKKISNLFSRNSNREEEHREEGQTYPVPTYVCPLNSGSHVNEQEHTAMGQQQYQKARNESGRNNSG